VKTLSANSLIDNERRSEKPSNPRRRVSPQSTRMMMPFDRRRGQHHGCMPLPRSIHVHQLFARSECQGFASATNESQHPGQADNQSIVRCRMACTYPSRGQSEEDIAGGLRWVCRAEGRGRWRVIVQFERHLVRVEATVPGCIGEHPRRQHLCVHCTCAPRCVCAPIRPSGRRGIGLLDRRGP
jgi:hypothetical protein